MSMVSEFPGEKSRVRSVESGCSASKKQRPQLHGTNDQIQKTSNAEFLEMKDTIFQLQKHMQNVLFIFQS